MASTLAYNLMSDDTHYTFNVVCTCDPRKAKVSYLKAENAIRVRAPPRRGTPPIDARIYVPSNCDTSDKPKMQVEQSESTLAISWPKVTPTAYRIVEGALEVPPCA